MELVSQTCYDQASKVILEVDPLGHSTTYAYDSAQRLERVTDNRGNATVFHREPGKNRIQKVEENQTLPGGGLGRLEVAVPGEVTTTRTYDSLSRLRGETNLGRGVTYTYDSVDAVSRIDYPSALPVRLERAGDALNRVQSVQWDLPDPVTVTSYGYRGAGRVATATPGPLTRTVEYEPGTNRQAGARFEKAGGARVFEEAVRWTPHDLKKAVARGDLNDRSVGFTYDGANRLEVAEYVANIDSSVPISRALATVPDRFAFTYDAAQNLKSKTTAQVCEADTATLPLDGSGRNRPGSVDGVNLTWDSNGNLKTKGDLTFYYDFQNRLTRVAGPAGNVATYTYDAFNRRVRPAVGGQTYETVWDDWQPIEEWQSSDQITYELRSRRTYGLGLDEIVALGIDFDGDGTLTKYTPIYDHAGNLAMVTDAAGKIVERYEYSPYGDQWILVDSTPPTIEQVRSVGDELWVEFSEEVQRDLIDSGVSSGQFYLKNLTSGATVNVELSWPVTSGRQANRRLVVRGTDPPETTNWPAADESFELYIDASIVSDTFNNVATQTYQQTFIWPSNDIVFEDLANPRLDRICVASGAILELEFSEELSTAYGNRVSRISAVPARSDPSALWNRSLGDEPTVPGLVEIGAGAGGLSDEAINVTRFRVGLRAGLQTAIRQRVLRNIASQMGQPSPAFGRYTMIERSVQAPRALLPKLTDATVRRIFESASPGRGRVSAVGRALQKHSARPGSWLAGQSSGNAQANTAAGRQLLQDLLEEGQVTTATHPEFGNVVRVRSADGTGFWFKEWFS